MSLDALGRAAAADLFATTTGGLDEAVMLRQLEVSRRRRARSQAAFIGACAFGLVLIGWLVVGPGPRHSAPAIPVAPSPSVAVHPALSGNGPLVVLEGQHLVGVDPVHGGHVPATTVRLPAGVVRPEDIGLGGPAWSADGRTLYYPTTSEIRAFDVVTGLDVAWLPCASCQVSAAPDGRSMAVAQDSYLTVVDLATKASTVVVPPNAGQPIQPSWSRDSQRIAYVSIRPGEGSTLEVVNRDGTGRSALLRNDAANSWGLASPSWSGDDAVIAVLAVPDGKQRAPLRVVTVPSTGGPSTELTTVGSCFCIGLVPGLAWSPDGRQLAAVVDDGLVVVDARKGAEPHVVLPGGFGLPAWRPIP